MELRDFIHEVLGAPLFALAGHDFTLGALVGALIALVSLLVFSRWLRRWMVQRLQLQGYLDISTRETVSALTQYLIVTIGVVSILSAVGLQLSSFTVLAGAFGVGVGFGLQNIFSNFISGLIVMFERPVKIGDHVNIAGIAGDVTKIGMRATTLRTAQGSTVVVPNQALITSNVVNWDDFGRSAVTLQFRMLGPAEENRALLAQVVKEVPAVLTVPPPQVYLAGIDHAGKIMELHFHVEGDAEKRLRTVSAINEALAAELDRLGQKLAPNP
jgi:small-conductance mechanosensitive channel